MPELFPNQLRLPDGFMYSEEFLSPDEEQDLFNSIRQLDLHPMVFQGFEARRKVASFGYDYNFGKRSLTKGEEVPSGFRSLIAKVANEISMPENIFAELLVTEYPIGSVINWHRDAPPFDVIVGISILADCMFKLRPHDIGKRNRKAIISLPVKRRSIYVMAGPSREEWQHCIAPVLNVRYSITLRTLKRP